MWKDYKKGNYFETLYLHFSSFTEKLVADYLRVGMEFYTGMHTGEYTHTHTHPLLQLPVLG